jgi:hypothetical protein
MDDSKTERWTSEIGEVIRVEWGVMDDDCRVTECPSEQDANEYQAEHGGVVVAQETIRTVGWS